MDLNIIKGGPNFELKHIGSRKNVPIYDLLSKTCQSDGNDPLRELKDKSDDVIEQPAEAKDGYIIVRYRKNKYNSNDYRPMNMSPENVSDAALCNEAGFPRFSALLFSHDKDYDNAINVLEKIKDYKGAADYALEYIAENINPEDKAAAAKMSYFRRKAANNLAKDAIYTDDPKSLERAALIFSSPAYEGENVNFKEAGEKRTMAANMYENQGDLEKAIKLATMAIEDYNSVVNKNNNSIGSAWEYLGELKKKSGDYKKGEKCFAQALAYLDDNNDPNIIDGTRKEIMNCHANYRE